MRRGLNICEDFLLFDLQRVRNDTMRLKTLLVCLQQLADTSPKNTRPSVRIGVGRAVICSLSAAE